ncbi:MAG: hypothetical protein Q8K59_03125 [Nitrosomonas sp.]|nr:hypothetical protein [Nitrosomonas sp.]MDP1950080.1 hypothetical protein [Nitrosomonas sp.]
MNQKIGGNFSAIAVRSTGNPNPDKSVQGFGSKLRLNNLSFTDNQTI